MCECLATGATHIGLPASMPGLDRVSLTLMGLQMALQLEGFLTHWTLKRFARQIVIGQILFRTVAAWAIETNKFIHVRYVMLVHLFQSIEITQTLVTVERKHICVSINQVT